MGAGASSSTSDGAAQADKLTTAALADVSEATRKALDALPLEAKADLERLAHKHLLASPEAASAGSKTLFKALDTDGSGALDANELLSAVSSLQHPELSVDTINALIREVDLNGDGQIQLDEFELLLKSVETPVASPHLVLNFDVNQTVIMVDSAINAGIEPLLNGMLSNSCWGRMKAAADGEELPTWELVSKEPSIESSEEGLKTYLQYVVACTVIPDGADVAAVKALKAKRRSLIQTFTAAGQPGEPLAAHVARLSGCLELSADVLAAASAEQLATLGLSSGFHLFLPSFLHMLRSLKRQGRSFSLCFRTFGKDLPKLAEEFNAFCEGTHPAFHKEPKVVLDGSDGGCDMRMHIDGGSDNCGTWVRAPDGSLSLVVGTIEQPPREQSTADALPAFYAEGAAAVKVLTSADAIRYLRSRLHAPETSCTLALRDYFPGWEASGCKAAGGKPLFAEVENPHILQLFFDDHILPANAHIVDVRRESFPQGPPLPISATFGTHLIKAEPLLSIQSPSYFIDAVAAAETKWRAAWKRRAALVAALSDHGRLLAALAASASADAKGEKPQYVPHSSLAQVRRASDVTAADEGEDA